MRSVWPPTRAQLYQLELARTQAWIGIGGIPVLALGNTSTGQVDSSANGPLSYRFRTPRCGPYAVIAHVSRVIATGSMVNMLCAWVLVALCVRSRNLAMLFVKKHGKLENKQRTVKLLLYPTFRPERPPGLPLR